MSNNESNQNEPNASGSSSKGRGGPRIKVCGITLPEQVNALDEMNVSLAGFIFYPKSPRYMGNKIAPDKLKKIKGKIAKVGVFVNASYDELMRTVEEYRLDMVQLHGDETPRYCEKIADYISVVKAFRLGENDNIEWTTKSYQEVCDMFMFDTMGAGYGGTGKKFNWDVLKDAMINKPFFLSGGIEPGDESKLKEFMKEPVAKNLFAIDINSRFEVTAGVKNMEKIKNFVANLI